MKTSREFSRIEKLRQSVFEGRFSECVLLSTVESIRYFTGFKGEEDVAFALIPVAGKGMIVTDERFKTKIEMQVSKELFDILITEPSEEYLEALKKRFSPNIQYHFYYEGGYENGLRAIDFEEAKKQWPDTVWQDCTKEILNIRAIKDVEEISLIKKAIEITEYTLEHLVQEIKVGMTESKIAGLVTYLHMSAGAFDNSFEPIIATGVNSALIHGGDRQDILQKGDVLQLDVGCIFDGYCSDISRVMVVGPTVSKRQYEVFKAVLGVQEEMISRIQPGIDLNDLDKQHSDLLEEKGFEREHGLGHGVGLQIHEFPRVSASSEKYGKDIAKPGHVITIEPGIYLPGEFGIRIEDMILVTETGYEVLTSFPKDLITVGA